MLDGMAPERFVFSAPKPLTVKRMHQGRTFFLHARSAAG
jgi:hypothetical protein